MGYNYQLLSTAAGTSELGELEGALSTPISSKKYLK